MSAEVSDERLREAVSDVLDEKFDHRGRTRRDVLKAAGAGGVAGLLAGGGSASAATSTINGTPASLGQVAPGVYQWADPGGYAGPDSGRSNVTHDAGQLYHANDSGRRWYDNGNSWDELPPSAGQSKTIAQPGDLSSHIAAARDSGFSRLHVVRPADDSIYSFSSGLDFDLANWPHGIYIVIEPNVKIEGAATDWWFDVTDTSGSRVQRSFAVTSTRQDGRGPFFEYTGSGDPAGFYRSTDVLNPMCNVSTEGFENTAVDSTAILIRNDDNLGWSEGWYAGGSHLRCDRGLDFEDIDGSTPSFRDGTIGTLRTHGNDFCVRLSRNHRGLRIINLHMFPKADNCECLVLDGNFGGAMIGGLTFDDTDGYTGTVAIATGSQFISSEAPVIYGAYLNNIDTALSTTDSQDDVWEMGGEAGYMFYRRFSARDNGGPEWRYYRTGQFELVDDTGSAVFDVAGDGDISNPNGALTFNDRPYITDGWRVPQASGPGFLGTNQFEIYMSDGTDGNSQGDIVAAVDVGGTEQTEVISQRSNQT